MTSMEEIAKDLENMDLMFHKDRLVEYIFDQRQEATREEREKIRPIPVDAEYFKAEIAKAKREAIIQTAEIIKTVISDYSANSAKLAFNKCKKIIAEAREWSKQ